MIMHRLSRGPFVGYVKRHDHGPWQGWYAFTWSAEGQSGDVDRTSRKAAYEGLSQAYKDFFAQQMKSGSTMPWPRLIVSNPDPDTT